MGYILNQFNQSRENDVSVTEKPSTTYMTVITDGSAVRIENNSDSGVTGGLSLTPFYDEGIQFSQLLEQEKNYYLHTKIKRLRSNQTFYVYLCKVDNHKIDEQTPMQYLKTITVQAGAENEWVDFEIILTPILGDFNCIVFQLVRNIEDITVKETDIINPETGEIIKEYERISVRYPYIVYEEFSLINNLINGSISGNGQPPASDLIKIGVQSHPGLMMCINGEEIHVGRTGIYEIRNGEIVVNFFSVLAAAVEKPIIQEGEELTLDQYLQKVAAEDTKTSIDETNSKCIFANDKTRNINAFTLDYMFEDKEA